MISEKQKAHCMMNLKDLGAEKIQIIIIEKKVVVTFKEVPADVSTRADVSRILSKHFPNHAVSLDQSIKDKYYIELLEV